MTHPRWKYMWNPWEWLKWFYESLGHKNPALSALAIVFVFAMVGVFVWWRLDSQYRKDHPDSPPVVKSTGVETPPSGTGGQTALPPAAKTETLGAASREREPQHNNDSPTLKPHSIRNGMSVYGVQHVDSGGTGYQANGPGAHAGPVFTGDEDLIRSLELRVQMDIPTAASHTTNRMSSVGIQSAVALFDPKHTRYRFVTPDYRFDDWQPEDTIHRFGFVYTPDDAAQFAGHSIHFLASLNIFAIDYSQFLKTALHLPIASDKPVPFSISLVLNGIVVASWTMTAPPGQLENEGGLYADVSNNLDSVETVYRDEMEKRAHQ